MKTYLFDFDGTLVDSMPTFSSVVLRILEENRTPYPPDIVKTVTPLGLIGTAEYFVKMGMNRSREEIAEIMGDYLLDAYVHTIPAKENVIAVLRSLKERGDDLHVLTASPHLTLDPCLKRLGMYDLFTNVWSCDDFATTKADPGLYHMVAERIGKPVDQILFLDDNLHANKTARTAGMQTCGVYDASSAEYEEEMKETTDYYIYDFSQLLTL